MLDISHQNSRLDFHQLASRGVKALAQKATQGVSFVDPTFKENMDRALEVGWIRLCYHFCSGDPSPVQFANLERAIAGVGKVYIVLDVEFNPEGSQPTADVVNELVTLIVGKYGRHPILYGSDVLKEMIGEVSVLCPLWIADYSHEPTWAQPSRFLIWQYSKSGDTSHGIPSGVDCNQWMSPVQTFADWYAIHAFAA